MTIYQSDVTLWKGRKLNLKENDVNDPRHNHITSCECLHGANTTKKISFETGNKLAVLRFEGDGVSDPLIEHLTEELRQSSEI